MVSTGPHDSPCVASAGVSQSTSNHAPRCEPAAKFAPSQPTPLIGMAFVLAGAGATYPLASFYIKMSAPRFHERGRWAMYRGPEKTR